MPDPDASRSGGSPLREWHRGYEEAKIAGVCAGVASQLEFPVTAVRAVFVLIALPPFHFLGVYLYLILWLLMPPSAGAPSALDRALESVSRLVGDAFGRDEKPRRRARDD